MPAARLHWRAWGDALGTQRQSLGFQRGEVQADRSAVDVEPDDLPASVQVDLDAVGNFTRLFALLELDVEAVGFGIVVQFRRVPLLKPRFERNGFSAVVARADTESPRLRPLEARQRNC